MTSPVLRAPLRVLLVSSNFCRSNEPRDAYGASCLVSAFRNSPTNAGDTLDVFTSDLNRFQKMNSDFNIDWNLVASEVVTRALIGYSSGVTTWSRSVFSVGAKRWLRSPAQNFVGVFRTSSLCWGEPPFLGVKRIFADVSRSRICLRSATAKRYSRIYATISIKEFRV